MSEVVRLLIRKHERPTCRGLWRTDFSTEVFDVKELPSGRLYVDAQTYAEHRTLVSDFIGAGCHWEYIGPTPVPVRNKNAYLP